MNFKIWLKAFQIDILMNLRHNALFNNKLRTTGGRYMLDSHNIEINLNNISIMVKCINRYN